MGVLFCNVCSDYDVLRSIDFSINIFSAIFILVPILMIVLPSVDLFKAVVSNDNELLKKATNKIVKRLIMGVAVFFVPLIGTIFITFLNDNMNTNINVSECLANINNLDYYKNLDDMKTEQEKHEKEERERARILAASIANNYDDETTDEGSSLGQTYNLSDDQISYLTGVAVHEQGTPEGAAVEVSLMLNRYELHGSGYSSVYEYVKNSRWFHPAKVYSVSYLIAKGNANPAAKSRVKSVIKLGNRSLALYVDEHDCINCYGRCSNGNKGDICYLKEGNRTISSMAQLRNKNTYVRDKTVIYNIYDGVYTFYSFPCSGCDPFGYTAGAKRKYDRLNRG